MSYLVLARKWRPQRFEDLVGQSHVSNTLSMAIQNGRVAHAYLFCGTRGVGKTTSARLLAKALNCEKGPTPSPCGACPSCVEISQGASTDVIEIDGASNRGIDEIRSLQENVRYASLRGRYRVFIIDEVHMITVQAFNALLKTLEEPPPNVVFIFATTEPSRVPQTILSRCQRYDFRMISVAAILDRLKEICKEEKIAAEETALFVLAKRARGSMRDALSLLDQLIAVSGGNITGEGIQDILGLVGQDIFEQLLTGIAEKNAEQCLEIVEKIFASGFDVQEFISEFAEQIRLLLYAKAPQALQASQLGLSEAQIAFYRKIVPSFSEGDLIRMASWVNTLTWQIRRSTFPRFEIEICLLKMIQAGNTVEVSEILRQLGGAPPRAASNVLVNSKASAPTPGPSARPQPPPPASPRPPENAVPANPPSVQSELKENWTGFLDQVMQEKPLISTFLSHAQLAGETREEIQIAFPADAAFQLDQLKQSENRQFIEAMIQKRVGRRIRLRLILQPSPQSQKPVPQASHAQPKKNPVSYDKAAEKEPIMDKILEVFDGDIVDSQ